MSKEFEVQQELTNKRKKINNFDELVNYLKDIEQNYNCGYGESPRAIAQAALAVAWYLADCFGITGFQAGFVMWDFIRGWQYPSNKCGLKLVNYDDMLYPQCEHKFQKTIGSSVFRSLQSQAKQKLSDSPEAHPHVISHWEKIANGEVPFGYTVADD